jgi:hypothetical protein
MRFRAGGARGFIAVGLAESWRWPRELARGQAVRSIGYRTRLAVQRHEDEWGLGSGDQKSDCRMINESQDATRTSADERVIEVRADIDQHQACNQRPSNSQPARRFHPLQ